MWHICSDVTHKMSTPKRSLVYTLLTLSLGGSVPRAVAGPVAGRVMLVSGAPGDAAKKLDSSSVVVWLEPNGPARTAGPSSPKQATMNQRNKTFLPHVLAIEVGTAVDFPNNDPMDHNAFSNFDGQIFDVHLYSPQTSRRVVFRRLGMVKVFCNIHETMGAVIAVLPTPYFAVTVADGRFEVAAPAGDYKLRFWHERAQPDVLARLERQVTVVDGPLTIPETRLAVGNQIVVAHKDKYGHDYPDRPTDYLFYPGARR